MNKAILITRPNYDDATSYSFYYAGLVIKEAESKGIDTYDLKNPRLTKSNFTKVMEDKNPLFIFFNAHGDDGTIYGDKVNGAEEALIRQNVNHNLLDFRLVYARTCWSGKSLGKVVTGGCFIGYDNPFSFYVDSKWTTVPANDNVAKLFFEPSNVIASSLIKGNTAEEAVSKSHTATKKSILRLMKNKNEPGTIASIRLLWGNMQSTVVIGNKNMKFE